LTSTTLPIAFFFPWCTREKKKSKWRLQSKSRKLATIERMYRWISNFCWPFFVTHKTKRKKREGDYMFLCVSPSATFSIMTSLLLEFFREKFFEQTIIIYRQGFLR
jgi:hypothetical protein